MIKKLLLTIGAVLALSWAAPSAAAGVQLKKGQGLACEMILCAVGIVIPESHSECRRVIRDWTIYMATLGPFKRRPRCPIVDANNVPTGNEELVQCSAIQSPTERNQCYAADQPPRGVYDCDSYADSDERSACYASCSVRFGSTCFVDVAPLSDGVYECSQFADYTERALCESSCTDTRVGQNGQQMCYVNVQPPPPGNYQCDLIEDPAERQLCEYSCKTRFNDPQGNQICVIP